MNMKRKLLCVTVLTMLLLAVTAGSAFAAVISVDTTDDLAAAVSGANAGDTIQLTKNDTLLNVNICKAITINTDKYTLQVPSGSDVVLENVTITGNTPNKTIISVFGKLTLGNGTTVEKTVEDASGEGTNVIYMGNGGSLTVVDGATISSSNSRCIDAGLSSTAKIYIYGGNINNVIVAGGGDGAELLVKGGTLQGINGYSNQPGKILISGGSISSIWRTDGVVQYSSCCTNITNNGFTVAHQSELTKTDNIYHCDICGGDYKDEYGLKPVLPAAVRAHKPETDEAVDATCTEKGWTEGSHCSVCGVVLVAQQETDKKDHTPVTDNAVAATCTETGLTEGSHCSVCMAVLTAQTTINALGHDWGSWTKVDSTTHKRICKREGCAAEETAAHIFQNRTCTGCSYTKPADHDYSGSTSSGSTVVKPAPVVPQTQAQTGFIQLTVDSLQAKVFGTPVMLDCKPFIQSDRTMVPIRFVAEHMGCMVDWNADLQQVSITRPGSGVMTLTIGQIPAGFDAAPVIQNDRTMVPIRYISELLGYHVSWDGVTETVTITR